MAYEFTRLADVTAIEEVKEEDSVLVVQDGEVKRAPKTAVGGAGGGISVVIDWVGDNYDDFHAPEGSYEIIRELINNKDYSFNIVVYRNYGDYEMVDYMKGMTISGEILDIYFTELSVVWYPDGRIIWPD